jgi:hypothetical protein
MPRPGKQQFSAVSQRGVNPYPEARTKSALWRGKIGALARKNRRFGEEKSALWGGQKQRFGEEKSALWRGQKQGPSAYFITAPYLTKEAYAK